MPPFEQKLEKHQFDLAAAHAAAKSMGTFTEPVLPFYSTKELPFGVFSNFWPAAFVIQGVTFKTSEHYFQALKFQPTDKAAFDEIVAADNCMEVTKIGRDRSRILRPDWEQVKRDVMFDALVAKYFTHDQLFDILILTGDSKLVEHTKNDSYWGDGMEWEKENNNWLGKLLVKLRDMSKSLTSEQRAVILKALSEKGVNMLREQEKKTSASAAASSSSEQVKKTEEFQ
jgi:N-glycosidase YbiA